MARRRASEPDKRPDDGMDALGRPTVLPENKEASGFDAADPVAVNNAKKEEGARRRADADVLRHIMHKREGRDWLYRLLNECHIYSSCIGPSPHDTYFLLGERNVGNRILQDAQRASPDMYLTMIKEQNEKKDRRES